MPRVRVCPSYRVLMGNDRDVSSRGGLGAAKARTSEIMSQVQLSNTNVTIGMRHQNSVNHSIFHLLIGEYWYSNKKDSHCQLFGLIMRLIYLFARSNQYCQKNMSVIY